MIRTSVDGSTDGQSARCSSCDRAESRAKFWETGDTIDENKKETAGDDDHVPQLKTTGAEKVQFSRPVVRETNHSLLCAGRGVRIVDE